MPRRAADDHGLGVFSARGHKHVVDGRSHGKLVYAGPFDVAGNAQHLRAGRFLGADAFKPRHALGQNSRGQGKRLDVVHGGGHAVQTGVYRERRAVASLAAVPFETFDQRRFFAAYVSPAAHVYVNVEGEAFFAQNVVAQQTGLAPLLQAIFQSFEQVSVLAAEVDNA